MKLFPQDKANHYAYGSWVATVAACIVMLLVVKLFPRELPWLFAIGAIAGAAGALAAGVAKELLDDAANDAATLLGQPAPHGVERSDIVATALGAVPVAVPLLLLQQLALR